MHPTIIAALIAIIGLGVKDWFERRARKKEAKRKAYESFIGKAMPLFLEGFKPYKDEFAKFYHSEGKALIYMYGSMEVIKLITNLETNPIALNFKKVVKQCRKELKEFREPELEYADIHLTGPNAPKEKAPLDVRVHMLAIQTDAPLPEQQS